MMTAPAASDPSQATIVRAAGLTAWYAGRSGRAVRRTVLDHVDSP